MNLLLPQCSRAVLTVLVCLAATAVAQDPKTFAGNKPETILPKADGTLVLPASKCEVYGTTLQYMAEDKALGWWNTADDRAVWKLSDVKPGVYEVWFEWSCADESAGNTFLFDAGDEELKGTISSTGSWQKHKKAKFGTIDLPAGDYGVELRAEGPIKEALGDFREVKLVPAKD
jgi:hypothetical protein